jgi:hypothetical protein
LSANNEPYEHLPTVFLSFGTGKTVTLPKHFYALGQQLSVGKQVREMIGSLEVLIEF